jgi:glycosyltransferase involved in cell wall biosynthesis
MRDKMTVIHHGVVPFWSESPSAEDWPSDFALDLPFAFYFGNIETRKNVQLSLAAMELVREEHPDLQFVLSGSAGWPAWDSQRIVDELSARPWVHYLGRRSDHEVRALMGRASMFLFPSRYEGFGLPVLEAMACGARVVCSTRGSLREVAGDACFTFDDLTPEAMAEACHTALATDQTAQRARAKDRAATFTWERSYAKHIQVLAGA